MQSRTPSRRAVSGSSAGINKSWSGRSHLSNRSHNSFESHRSVAAIGSHPLGSLHVHDPDASPTTPRLSMVLDSEDEGMPPLEPPAEVENAVSEQAVFDVTSNPGQVASPELLRHGMGGGDVILILDLPEHAVIGYDSISFTAKHFGGLRDVPRGPHFIWVGHPTSPSSRSGFWVMSSGEDQVHVMQWDKYNEVLDESARAEARIQAENVDAIHSKLVSNHDPAGVNVAAADRQQTVNLEGAREIWRQLTGSITSSALDRITGESSANWTLHSADCVQGAVLMASEIELDKRLSVSILQSRELHFTSSQVSRTFSTGQTGGNLTAEATDATSHVLSLITSGSDSDTLVGDFQFAFIVGMHLGNDSCVQQWWHMLLRLFLRAYALPARQPALATAFLRTLAAQITYSMDFLEGSILDYGEGQAKELRLALTVYKRRLDELLLNLGEAATPEQLTVGAAFAKVEAVVATSLDWDIRAEYMRKGKVMMEDGEEVELEVTDLQAEDERGEWAPEVVELDEGGRERGLVSWTD